MALNDTLEEPIRSSYATIVPCVKRDGSVIRELMQPSVQGNRWSRGRAAASTPEASAGWSG